MIKIRAQINKTENRKTIEKSNEITNWFFLKIKNVDKPLDINWPIIKERRIELLK